MQRFSWYLHFVCYKTTDKSPGIWFKLLVCRSSILFKFAFAQAFLNHNFFFSFHSCSRLLWWIWRHSGSIVCSTIAASWGTSRGGRWWINTSAGCGELSNPIWRGWTCGGLRLVTSHTPTSSQGGFQTASKLERSEAVRIKLLISFHTFSR